MAKLMLDVEDADALLWEKRGEAQRSTVQFRTVVSPETHGDLPKYTVSTTDQKNVPVIDERTAEKGQSVTVILLRTAQKDRGKKKEVSSQTRRTKRPQIA